MTTTMTVTPMIRSRICFFMIPPSSIALSQARDKAARTIGFSKRD
jgi:hypothetical protein